MSLTATAVLHHPASRARGDRFQADYGRRYSTGRGTPALNPTSNPPPERRGSARYSMPFFLHLASDFEIVTLPGCVSAENPDCYPAPITADGYLRERLREIGLL